jgi:hypothetical protein
MVAPDAKRFVLQLPLRTYERVPNAGAVVSYLKVPAASVPDVVPVAVASVAWTETV